MEEKEEECLCMYCRTPLKEDEVELCHDCRVLEEREEEEVSK